MNNPLYLFIGKSASGKTTVAEVLERKHGFTSLQSYTTRPKRYDNETGHTFIDNDAFDKLENIIAYTEYNKYRYCCTKDQIDNASIYVIDVPGVETLLEKYETDRPIVVVYFDASIRTRIDRMIDRHDSDMAIVSRLYNDEESDWEKDLSELVWHYKNNVGKNVDMYKIDANNHIENVMLQIANHIGFGDGDNV